MKLSKNRGLDFSTISSQLAGDWAKLSAVQKQGYKAAAEMDSERYRDEMDKDGANLCGYPTVNSRGPKRCRTSYSFFACEVRPSITTSNPSLGLGDISKLIALEWKKVSTEMLVKCDALAAEDKNRYLTEKSKLAAAQKEAETRNRNQFAAEQKLALQRKVVIAAYKPAKLKQCQQLQRGIEEIRALIEAKYAPKDEKVSCG